jgi:hypothetical protein
MNFLKGRKSAHLNVVQQETKELNLSKRNSRSNNEITYKSLREDVLDDNFQLYYSLMTKYTKVNVFL